MRAGVTEALFLVGTRAHPANLATMVADDILQFDTAAWASNARRAMAWLHGYEEHEPDFTDAYLIAWYEAESGARVWTFDSEFRTTWRTSRGKSINLVPAK